MDVKADQKLNLIVTVPMLKTILGALGEIPQKYSGDIVNDLNNQVMNQMQEIEQEQNKVLVEEAEKKGNIVKMNEPKKDKTNENKL